MSTHDGPELAQKDGHRVIDCTSCGWAHLDPLPHPDDLALMYEREYYEDAADPGSWLAKDRREADYWALEFADKEALWRTAIGGRPGRALDVGCSGGLLLEHLVGKGWVAEGIEPAVTAVAECRRLGLSVHPGLYGDIELPEGAYDVVHARLVMEHLAFPRQFVQWAFARLRPGGVLTVQVPNEFNKLQLLARDLLAKPDWWVAPPFHLNYFTFESLERLIAAEGFELLGRDASFPVEWFLLMGDDYIGHDDTGKVIHAKRMQLEAQLERAGLRAPLHAHLAAEGVGREAIVHAAPTGKVTMTTPTHGPDVDVVDHFALGRAELDAGHHAQAFEHFVEASRDQAGAHRAAACAECAQLSIFQNHPHEAIAWTEQARAFGGSEDQADFQEAVARLKIDQPKLALELLDIIDDPSTEWITYADTYVDTVRAEALTALGRHADALEVLLRVLAVEPTSAQAWRGVTAVAGAGVDPTPALRQLPDANIIDVLPIIAGMPAADADRVAEAMWALLPGDTRVLLLGGGVAPLLDPERALEWSSRMRSVGLDDNCPLLAIAADHGQAAVRRVRAAAVAAMVFDDPRARPLLELAATHVGDGDLRSLLVELVELAPDYADSFVAAAASTTRRCMVLAVELVQLGATEIALAVASHGLGLIVGDPKGIVRTLQKETTLGERARLAAAATAAGRPDLAAFLTS